MKRSAGVEVSRADGAAGPAALHQQPVVSPAQQLLVPQGELVPRQELSAAHRAAETLDVVNVVPGPHHQVAAAEAQVAFGAFDAEQPAEDGVERGAVLLRRTSVTQLYFCIYFRSLTMCVSVAVKLCSCGVQYIDKMQIPFYQFHFGSVPFWINHKLNRFIFLIFVMLLEI